MYIYIGSLAQTPSKNKVLVQKRPSDYCALPLVLLYYWSLLTGMRSLLTW